MSSFLHVRGGVSYDVSRVSFLEVFSPRAWRCFLIKIKFLDHVLVFSTCVEVFPFLELVEQCIEGFLHVRGGVSGRYSTK